MFTKYTSVLDSYNPYCTDFKAIVPEQNKTTRLGGVIQSLNLSQKGHT